MKHKILLPVLILALMFTPLACQDEEVPPELQCFPPNWTVENVTEFLSLAEQCNTSFSRYDAGEDGFSYTYRRKIGNISV